MGARTFSIPAAVLLVAAACATAGGGAGARPVNVISAEEIASIDVRTAYEAVMRLQPSWLNHPVYTVVSGGDRAPRTPAVGDASSPHVYVGNANVGNADYLRDIDATDVLELRYYDAMQATSRFGPGHPGGVIELSLR